jgi:hypothetical protein
MERVGGARAAPPMRDDQRQRIHLMPVLHDILAQYKANHRGRLDDLLFTTARGRRRDKDNINKCVLKRAELPMGAAGLEPATSRV